MSQTELHQLSVAELAAQLRAKQVSATEAAQHFLARAKQHQNLGAFVAINEDATLAQAKAADALIAEGKGGKLAGVPIAHKDIFVTKDFPTTAASKMLEGYQSPFDATVVKKLADAGVVTLGKLNCDEFAMGGANENSAVAPVGFDAPSPCATPGTPSACPAARPAARPPPWPRVWPRP
jgi:aspartyl-tRNA(Asn)/glutamyl-tRNA(Gln) amidotransferase subunit A